MPQLSEIGQLLCGLFFLEMCVFEMLILVIYFSVMISGYL
uniref:Uncharacterized protein n=1 Tax=Magnetospirillum gryphiswaldense TaxID=55518 RepID=A4TWL8_9PROT|nr:hypothetical protein MGR_0741 [Magnetospirillum gryphiswaldense MSR-1]